MVVAPHPDDEVLGCGGTLLRRKAAGAETGWLIVTGISEAAGWSAERVRSREAEIRKVEEMLGFSRVYQLRLPTTRLDSLPMAEIVARFGEVFTDFQPTELFVPHPGDVHSDHRVCFDATASCAKWFRYTSVRRVLAYETLSETEFGLDSGRGFVPNIFVDISEYLERKVAAMEVYETELGSFPFPRSVAGIRALAMTRGAAAGCEAAEAFHLLREVEGRP